MVVFVLFQFQWLYFNMDKDNFSKNEQKNWL